MSQPHRTKSEQGLSEGTDGDAPGWLHDDLADRARDVARLHAVSGDLAHAASRIARCFREGGRLLIFGNGGSAAQAQHLAGEFVGRYGDERPGLPAVALAADGTVMTGVANDFGFVSVFSRQIEALGRPGDVALAISTSGTSPNTVAGATAARDHGLDTIAFVGSPDSPLHRMADIGVVTGAMTFARVQEASSSSRAICSARWSKGRCSRSTQKPRAAARHRTVHRAGVGQRVRTMARPRPNRRVDERLLRSAARRARADAVARRVSSATCWWWV